MPLGGYCEMCSRWVWVNGRGECQFGHPASAVHEVQPLKPRSEEDRVPTLGRGPRRWCSRPRAPSHVARRRRPRRRRRPPRGGPSLRRPVPAAESGRTAGGGGATPCGSCGPSPSACSTGSPSCTSESGRGGALWLLASLVYLLPIALTVASVGSGYLGLAIGFQLFMSGVSMLHAFVARPRYRAIMFGDPPSGTAPAPPPVLVRSPRPALPRGLDDDVADGDPRARRLRWTRSRPWPRLSRSPTSAER